MYHANQRQGTVRTLARGEVAGSTRKMFRQKGTGNARTGGIRNPIKKGGGHAKQKRPKDWRQAMPKKARRLARNSAILLQDPEQRRPRRSTQINLDAAQDQAGRRRCSRRSASTAACCSPCNGRDENVEKSARNIDRTTLTTVDQLNAWDILQNRTLLLTRDGLEQDPRLSE